MNTASSYANCPPDLTACFERPDEQRVTTFSSCRRNSIYNRKTINMNKQYQWRQNTYQPGLFTFYKENHSLSPKSTNTELKLKPVRISQPKRKNTEKKEGELKRYQTQYMCWNTHRIKEERRALPLSRVNISQRKIQKKYKAVDFTVYKQPWKEPKIQIHRETKSNSKSQIQLKKTNLNEVFKFDLHRDKKRWFISEASNNFPSTTPQQPKLTFSKSYDKQKTADIPNSTIKQSAIQQFRPRNESTMNFYSNFVQILVQKRKKQIEQKLKDKELSRLFKFKYNIKHREKNIFHLPLNSLQTER